MTHTTYTCGACKRPVRRLTDSSGRYTAYAHEDWSSLCDPAQVVVSEAQEERFTADQVKQAIDSFLEFGKNSLGVCHQGYYSAGGWAHRCLSAHLKTLTGTGSPVTLYSCQFCPALVVDRQALVAHLFLCPKFLGVVREIGG